MGVSNPSSEMETEVRHSGLQNLLRLLATLAVCAAVAFVYLLEPHEEVELVREPPPKPVVSIVPVPVQKTRAVVETLAQIKPMWSAELHASHSARVLSVSDRALAGRRVERGDVLIELDPSALLSDLRAAELALVEAEVRLSQARQQTELRRREAERVGDENPSEFALLLPDLRVAETNLVSAQASVAAAQAASANAKIRAPFDGFVTTRIVSPGQSVSAGEELLSVVTGTAFEIEVGLSSAQWRLLEHPIRKTQAKVYALDGTALGTAEIRDAGGFRDEETREFRVFLEINRDQNLAPDVQLISGALVNVAFVGRTFDNTLQIPENSFTREGGVWYVDELGRLQRFQPDVLWRSDGDLIIAAPADGPVYEIATVPLASFLTGTEVSAVPDERP